MSYYLENSDGLRLILRAQPRASRSRLALAEDGSLKAYTTAPPVDSAANAAIAALLAEVCGVPKGKVELLVGDRSRTKHFLVRGESRALLARLQSHLAAGG